MKRLFAFFLVVTSVSMASKVVAQPLTSFDIFKLCHVCRNCNLEDQDASDLDLQYADLTASSMRNMDLRDAVLNKRPTNPIFTSLPGYVMVSTDISRRCDHDRSRRSWSRSTTH